MAVVALTCAVGRQGIVEALDTRALAVIRGEVSENQASTVAWRVRVYVGLDVVHGVWPEGGGCCLFALLRHPSSSCPPSWPSTFKDVRAERGQPLAEEQEHIDSGLSSTRVEPLCVAATQSQVLDDEGAAGGGTRGHGSVSGARQHKSALDDCVLCGKSHGLDWERVLTALSHFDLNLHSCS